MEIHQCKFTCQKLCISCFRMLIIGVNTVANNFQLHPSYEAASCPGIRVVNKCFLRSSEDGSGLATGNPLCLSSHH